MLGWFFFLNTTENKVPKTCIFTFQTDEDPPLTYSQTFTLKPIASSFYVQHDIFRLGLHDSLWLVIVVLSSSLYLNLFPISTVLLEKKLASIIWSKQKCLKSLALLTYLILYLALTLNSNTITIFCGVGTQFAAFVFSLISPVPVCWYALWAWVGIDILVFHWKYALNIFCLVTD